MTDRLASAARALHRRPLVAVRPGGPAPGAALDPPGPGRAPGPRCSGRSAGRGGGDRLLWAWAVVPVLVLSTATVKNAHYAIHALPPLSVWAALGLVRVGLAAPSPGVVGRPGPPRGRGPVPRPSGLGSGLGHLVLGPRFDRRGAEWAFCERIGRALDPVDPPGLPLRGLGPQALPHAVRPGPARLGRPPLLPEAARLAGGRGSTTSPPARRAPGPYALLGRDRDLPALRRLGRVETLMRGPADRFDRTFTLFRVTPGR